MFAYQTGSADWANNTYVSSFMYNQYVSWSTTTPANAWVYTPVKYWPNGIDAANANNDPSNTATEAGVQKLSFFAYAPYTANVDATTAIQTVLDGSATALDYPSPAVYGDFPTGLDNTKVFKTVAYDADAANIKSHGGVLGMTDWEQTVDPWLNYYLNSTEADKAVDLLWGQRGQYSYDETDNVNNNLRESDPTYTLNNDYNVNLTKQSVKEKVRFLFKHALAKIGGSTATGETGADAWKKDPKQSGLKVVADIDANSPNHYVGSDNQSEFFGTDFTNTQTLITLVDVKIRDAKTYGDEAGTTLAADEKKSDLNSWGWFNIATGTWDKAGSVYTTSTGATTSDTYAQLSVESNGKTDTSGSAAGTPGLNVKIKEVGIGTSSTKAAPTLDGTTKLYQWNTTEMPSGVTTTAEPVYDNAGDYPGILLIPGGEQTLYITVDYIVRTADKQLANKYTEVEQIITNKVSISGLEANKYYTLVIHLGLTSVKFEAIVADWAMTSDATFNEDGTTNEGTLPDNMEGKSVWLPSNVVNTTKITAAAGSSHKKVTVDAGETEYKLTVDGLTNGHVMTWATDHNVAANTGTSVAIDATSKEFTLTLTQNTTTSPVTSTVTMKEWENNTKAEGGNAADVLSTTVVTITQPAGELVLTPSTEEIASGEAFTVVATLKGGQKIVDLANANAVVTGGTTPGSLGVDGMTYTITPTANEGNATANSGTEIADVVVTVTVGGLTESVTIKQLPANMKITTLTAKDGDDNEIGTYTAASGSTPADIQFAKDAIDVTLTPTVTNANGGGTISGIDKYSCSDSWLSVNPSDGRLKASANTTGADRKATVTIYKNDAIVKFTVTQKGS